MAHPSQAKTKEQLAAEGEKTLEAIRKLRECPEFMGWFMDMLRTRRAGHDKAVLHDSMTPEEREVRRRIGREYDDLLVALDKAEGLAKKAVDGKI